MLKDHFFFKPLDKKSYSQEIILKYQYGELKNIFQ